MSKVLFYGGLISCALLGLLLIALPGRVTLLQGSFPTYSGSDALSPLIPVYLLVLTIAAAAIFVRMASLLAARNLFAAFFSGLVVLFSTLTASLLCAVQLRMALLRSGAASSEASRFLAEFRAGGLYLLGWAVSVMFVALRPYFRIQASPILAAVAWLPLPLFVSALSQEMIPGSSHWASTAFRAVISLLFGATVFHCLRHRHLFIEVTNLRELLDVRIDPARRRLPLGSDVAFDG